MKKKLLFSNFGHQWNALVSKFFRLQRRINSPVFAEVYSEKQQKSLLGKLQNLYHRLEKMQNNVGIKLAGTALALMMVSAVAVAQPAGYGWKKTTAPVLKSKWNPNSKLHTFPSMAIADADKDGDDDIYVGTQDGYLLFFKNDGTGAFPDSSVTVQSAGAIIDVGDYMAPAFADLDGDGNLDLYAGDYYGKIHVFKNDGAGNFTEGPYLQADGVDIQINGTYANPTFADVDKDGDLDLYIATTNSGYGAVEVYKNNAGVFTHDADLNSAGAPLVIGYSYTSCAFADMDKDGNMDLYVGTGGAGRDFLNYYKNDGTAFGAVDSLVYSDGPANTVIHEFGRYSDPTFADMDKDGNLELWAMDWACNLSVWKYGLLNTNVPSLQDNKKIVAYPNPATDFITFGKANTLATVKIFNSQGKMVANFSNVIGKLNVSNLKRGIYVVEVNDGSKSYSQKLVKE